MDNNEVLKILRQEIAKYGGEGLNCVSYITENLEQMIFTSTTLYRDPENPRPLVDLFVKFWGGKIIIEEDRNSDPFYEELVDAGIPREQIILAYAGESVPDIA